jgi:hypothetical protein
MHVEGRKGTIGDELADDRAPLFVHVHDARCQSRSCGELLDMMLPPPQFEGFRAIRDLQRERGSRSIHTIHRRMREASRHPGDGASLVPQSGGQASFDVRINGGRHGITIRVRRVRLRFYTTTLECPPTTCQRRSRNIQKRV